MQISRCCSARFPPSANHSGRAQTGIGASGFTLLEMLVAIMILTMLMTAAFGAVRLSGRSYEAGVQRADASEQMRSTADFLRRQLAQLMPVSSDEMAPLFAFTGGPEEIRFVASAPRHPAITGLIDYRVSTQEYTAQREEEYANSRRLVLSYGPFDPGSQDLHDISDNRQLILADDLAAVSFQFFGTKADGHSRAAWHDMWQADKDGLPELVRINLTVANDAQRWPELILRIRVEEPS